MTLRRSREQSERFVSAKDLAEMGFCEKRVLLAHKHGQRITPVQERRAERGRRAHEQYYLEGLAAAGGTSADRRCFVATCLFGERAWQTIVLRCYRDEVLLQARLGRRLVAAYYRFAPWGCRVLARASWLQPLARAVVGTLARLARRHTGGSK